MHTAYDRSFAHYQDRKRRGNRGSPRNRLIAQRVRVLKRCGYIEDEKLTARGELARKVNGYEIQVAELYQSGVLEGLSVAELVALFVAIVYEARKADDTEPKPLPRIEKESVRLVRSWRKEERRQELPELTKRPDFSLNAVAMAWAKGSGFDELRRFTSVSDGDLVRTFRMALQLMRQLRRVLDKSDSLRQKLQDAADLIDRDVVDARRQLELG